MRCRCMWQSGAREARVHTDPLASGVRGTVGGSVPRPGPVPSVHNTSYLLTLSMRCVNLLSINHKSPIVFILNSSYFYYDRVHILDHHINRSTEQPFAI